MLVFGQPVTLHLKNGDRITGTILSETASEIILSTSFAGQVTVAAGEVLKRETRSAEEIPAKTPSEKSIETSPPPVSPTGVPSGLVEAPPPAVKEGMAPAEPPPAPGYDFKQFLREWKGEVELGMNLAFSSKDRQTYSGRAKAVHVHEQVRNSLDYLFSYGRTEGVLSDNRMDGSIKTEYKLGKKFSLYNAMGAGYDEIRKIDLQYDVGPGLGYQWISLSNFVFRTELGGNYQRQYYAGGITKDRYSLRLAEESWWQISKRFRFEQKVEFFPQFDSLAEYRIRAEGNVNYLLRENIFLKLTVINLYDTEAPENVSHNDLQIRSSVGIKF